ncbi:response regulator [Leptothoe kymatousa TAU-MAC 1615]|uniref:histidine kinase n=1 Tax=Leptothoe kymatousa TAU-MAC 1615 TaxID=2364775 RepID=A0ABS5Y3L5_9CYAN|nr:response regulator [Leptothoe kymatousa]MBT9311969.1 response regulator [Leptothoe kymatousa TAU-MAC 1615]
MNRDSLLQGTGVAVAFLLLTVLGIKGKSVNVSQYQRYADLISSQVESDTEVELALLKERYTILRNDEPLEEALAEELAIQEELARDVPAFVPKDDQVKLKNLISRDAQFLQEKTELVNQFQETNGELQNALVQLPSLVNELKNTSDADLEKLIDDVLIYIMATDEQLVSSIENELKVVKAKLNAGEFSSAKDVAQVVQLSQMVLDNKPVTDALVDQVLNLPLTQNIRELENVFDQSSRAAFRQAALYRNLAYLVALSLIGVIAYTLVARLRQSTQRTTSVLENITDAFVAVDRGWKVTYVNAQAAEVLKRNIQGLLEQDFWKIFPESLGLRYQQQYRRAMAEQTVVSFETYYAPTQRWLQVRGYPGRDGLSLFLQDVTERKQAEEQLMELNRDLDSRVQDRTTKLMKAMEEAEEARVKAEDANRSKSEFLANMSHELRTPLNAIIGYSEMLEEEATDVGEEDFVPDLQKIQGAGKHLLGLINSVLDLSKIEAGRMELFLEEFSIKGLVDDIAGTITPVAHKNNNHLSVFCPADIGSLHADQTKLRQSLFNLLSNACKFTENGDITLTVEEVSTVDEEIYDGPWLRFIVSDTGIGMKDDQIEKIFDAFTQADASTTRKYGGTGLGLAITKQFINMMGGDISVESVKGQGTTFSLLIPQTVKSLNPKGKTFFAPALATEGDAPIVSSGLVNQSSQKTILVIDDDQDAREILRRSLDEAGYNVVCASNGEQGLALAEELLPDAITLDVMMPQMDGWSVLRQLKEKPTVADIPVILLSIVDDRPMGHSLGAADYLTKPIDRRRLLGVLEAHLSDQPSPTILVVEDDVNAREIMGRFLQRQDWTVDLASNGREALQYLDGTTPDLIVLDLMMPEIDGFEFIQMLRQNPDWQDIPVIVVTAKALTATDQQQLEGVARVYQKADLNRQELLSELQAVVSGKTVSIPNSATDTVSSTDRVSSASD